MRIYKTKQRKQRTSRHKKRNTRRNTARVHTLNGGNNDKTIVICQPWGGLGDNLQYTTLPELYTKQGYNVYISSKNAYRSDELYDLIWKPNPFIKGISDLPANAGAPKSIGNHGDCYIKNIEISHGLTEGYRIYPVIYYNSKHIDGIENYIFYDPTSVSSNPNDTTLIRSFKSVFDKYPKLTPMMLKFKKSYKDIKKDVLPGLNTDIYEIEDIYHFCDVIHSCKVLVSGFSGALVLASAVKQDSATPEVYSFYEGDSAPNGFNFKNIHYSKLIS